MDPDPPLRQALRPSGPPRAEFSARRRPEGTVIRLDGELDALTVPRLAAELNEVIHRSPSDLVLDLREVQFIDSAGVQFLLSMQRRLARRSRRLTVVCDEGPVRRVIEIARLDETLGVVLGEDEASG